ncbi:MAG: 4Fe-4S dicluster domain-containing protein [Myxococcota bacterium]
MNFGFVMDNRSCIGCHACSTACKSENQVPLGVHRTWVKAVEAGQYPDVRRSFQVTRCNHCSNPPCVRICPVSAMVQRDDGIVDFDSDACIGCKACMQACPYDAIHIDPETHTAAKCHYCAHRVDVGLEPACVVVCPEHAIIAGDLDDPESEISRTLAKHNVTVRKPEQGTAPKVFYIEGNELSLRPSAAAVPKSFAFADVVDDPHHIGAVGTRTGIPRETKDHDRYPVRVPDPQGLPRSGPLHIGGRMAEHMVQVAYTSRHHVPWHWPIPTYMVTKGIAAGVFGVVALQTLLATAGLMAPVVWSTVAPALGVALVMLFVTLGLLVYDLDRPDRFFYLLVRPQWRSWVARAAWILSGFAFASVGWTAVELAPLWGLDLGLADALRPFFAVLTLPTAVLAAVYTAFLFAQAEGRDLWQSPALPVQVALHATALGLGTLAVFDGSWMPFIVAVLLSVGVTLVADLTVAPPSELARRAARDMTWGRFAMPYWGLGIGLGHVVPLALLGLGEAWGPLAIGCAALGLLGWSWALVMAPQQLSNS